MRQPLLLQVKQMNNLVPPELSDTQLNELFPATTQDPADGTFELALALAGTVAAGSYTAGVLDYLMEALDAWDEARNPNAPNHSEAPNHAVIIRTLSGASGGAINGAVMLRAAGRAYPHGKDSQNPFYATWSGNANLSHMLATTDIDDGWPLLSLLNCKALDQQVDRVLAMTDAPPLNRSYLADPLRLTAMVGNVTGIPYRIGFQGQSGLGHDLVAHDDHLKFALTINGGKPEPVRSRPDEFALSSNSSTNWDLLGLASLATSSFPFAFRTRLIHRAYFDTIYRVVAIPGTPSDPSRVEPLVPAWSSFDLQPNSKTQFIAVDGGTVNNEPVDLARTSLSGMLGRNPRDKQNAKRAVILIDPFSDAEPLSTADIPSVVGLAAPLLEQFLYQARMKPADIALAKDENVYSRFLIAPTRPGIPQLGEPPEVRGSAALASGGLGGFIGFLDQSLLDHDFNLGRYNAYLFLTRNLYFPPNNLGLSGGWSAAQIALYADPDGDLPLIPLMKSLRDNPPKPPAWPTLGSLPQNLGQQVTGRLDAVFKAVLAGTGLNAIARGAVNAAWSLFGRSRVRDAILNAITSSLEKSRLM